MPKIMLHSPLWHTVRDISVRGQIIVDGLCLQGTALADYFDTARTSQDLKSLLHKANGLFAVIIRKPYLMAMATDRVRTIPLFYTNDTISDTPRLLATRPIELDFEAGLQYEASGATFPGYTLDQRVRQVPAGAYVVWKEAAAPQYFDYYSHTCTLHDTRPATITQVEKSIQDAFDNLRLTLDKRPVLLPLSGGYDSRLIACHLKNLACKDVTCYHVGFPNSPQHIIAQQVAQKLGFAYHLVNVSDAFPQEMLRDADFLQYVEHLGAYTNFVWLFEYVALRHMTRIGLIHAGDIAIPGHSGDFLTGSHIRKGGIDNHSTARNLSYAMAYRSFEYPCPSSIRKRLHVHFEDLLQKSATPVSAYQDFIMKHRQAQQIVNSARVYEHFGLQLRLPLWDNGLLELFRTLPYEQLIDCKLYRQYAHKVFATHGVDFRRPDGDPRPASYIKLWLKRHLPQWMANLLPHPADPTGEWAMAQTLLDDLRRQHIRPSHAYTTSNDIIKDWYLSYCLRSEE
ncbi:MAG: hypothetical protein IJ764_00655 [Bacteroidales bacterium]|nr:hypothetical protein [Bacteroidales bacterium]